MWSRPEGVCGAVMGISGGKRAVCDSRFSKLVGDDIGLRLGLIMVFYDGKQLDGQVYSNSKHHDHWHPSSGNRAVTIPSA